jgi:uncharacterized protein (TIGR02145 family)
MKKNLIYVLILLIFFFCTNCNESKKIFTAKEIYNLTVDNTVTVVTEIGLGSGFFIDSNIIVTNYHVIKGSNSAVVELNNSDKKYEILGYLAVDIANDLVLLKVDYSNKGFISIEDSLPNPGEQIYAIGSPIGLAKTISEGMISGVRNFDSKKLLQITVPISHGSSGCPIVNSDGKLVGIAVGGMSEGNDINFCIPTNYLKALLEFKGSYPKKLSSLSGSNERKVSGTDERKVNGSHERKVKTSKMGDQEWMGENLDVTTFRNGDEIFHATTAEEWENCNKENIPAWCFVKIDSLKNYPLGKNYNWYAVIDSRGLAPAGWHIPSKNEWSILYEYLGGESVAAKKMLSQNGWSDKLKIVQKNSFNAYPSFEIWSYKQRFMTRFSCAFWTSTKTSNGKFAYRASLYHDFEDIGISGGFDECSENVGTQIRCIRDK